MGNRKGSGVNGEWGVGNGECQNRSNVISCNVK